jgi:hypothetical protein
MKPLLPSLAPLDDQALLEELPRLARSERDATVPSYWIGSPTDP